MSQQPPNRPPEDWQPPPQQATEPYPGWGQQPPQGQPPQWGPPGQQPGWEPPQQPRRRRRVFMWVILAINGLFLWWMVSAVGGIADDCAGKVGSDLEACQTGTAIGGGIAFIFILAFWALVDIILLVIFVVTRRQLR
jgi:hypothetical protein